MCACVFLQARFFLSSGGEFGAVSVCCVDTQVGNGDFSFLLGSQMAGEASDHGLGDKESTLRLYDLSIWCRMQGHGSIHEYGVKTDDTKAVPSRAARSLQGEQP